MSLSYLKRTVSQDFRHPVFVHSTHSHGVNLVLLYPPVFIHLKNMLLGMNMHPSTSLRLMVTINTRSGTSTFTIGFRVVSVMCLRSQCLSAYCVVLDFADTDFIQMASTWTLRSRSPRLRWHCIHIVNDGFLYGDSDYFWDHACSFPDTLSYQSAFGDITCMVGYGL